jgi:regulatory protein
VGERKKPRGTARDRALNLLSFRDRSSRELEQRLLQAGYEPDEVVAALDGLQRVGLVDDERFARAIVEQQAGRRLSGRRAVAAALFSKGVDRATAEAALQELDGPGAERARADELARSRARRMMGLPPEVAFRRLSGLLARRGYPPAVCREAARAALAIDDDGA